MAMVQRPTSSTPNSSSGTNSRKSSLPPSDLNLEQIVKLTNTVGLEYADAKHEAERLELLRTSVRARIALRIDDGELSEAKLRRLTETDVEYTDFIEKLSEAKGKSEKLRIRYESYKNLFEAKRSMLSYQKAEMKIL